jgi:hypothetical protein
MKGDSKTLDFIKSWGGGVVSVAVFTIGLVAPVWSMRTDIKLIQKDIEIINTNHISHIQDLKQDIKSLTEKQAELDERMYVHQEALIKLLKE